MTALLEVRALNRATLARQGLLERDTRPPREMVEHLVGLQSQAPEAPYVGLWTRLVDFDPLDFEARLASRELVRLTLMRGTVHLVTAADACTLHPRHLPMLAQRFSSTGYARELKGLNLEEVAAAGAGMLAERPQSRAELGRRLAERWPGRDPASLAYTVDYLTPAVQATPRGLWSRGGPVRLIPLEVWLGVAVGEPIPLEELVLRYLAAFGPATVRDVQQWCGLTRLSEVVEGLRGRLRSFRDPAGQELFDLPEAPRPGADVPAPPRFLPAYDNVLLSHADRSRVIAGRRSVPLPPGNGARRGTLLVDGFYAANWRIEGDRSRSVLQIELFASAGPEQRIAIEREGRALLSFVAPDTIDADVAFSVLA